MTFSHSIKLGKLPHSSFSCSVTEMHSTFLNRHQFCFLISFCYSSNIDIFKYVKQYSTCTRENMLYFIMPRTYTNVEHVCIKVTLKGELISTPASSVVRDSEYESQVSEFESTGGKDFSFCIFSLSMRPSQVD